MVPCFEKRLLPLPPPPQSVPRSLLPQRLHRLAEVVEEVDLAGADTVEVDMAVLWPVDTAWVVATALVEAFTAGWVEASVAR
jgi:hypothetical protein